MSDDVVNTLFRANQRSVMVRDSKGRLPKNLVRRRYKRERIIARVSAKRARRQDEDARGTRKFRAKSEAIATKHEKGIDEDSRMYTNRNDRDNSHTNQISKLVNADIESKKDVPIDDDPKQVINSSSNYCIKGFVNDSANEAIKCGPALSSKRPRLRKRFLRVHRSVKKINTTRKITKSLNPNKPFVIDTYTCISKKNKKLKREIKKLMKLTEDALSTETIHSVSNGNFIHKKRKKLRVFKRNRKGRKDMSNGKVMIESFTSISSKRNRKLKREVKNMQNIVETAIQEKYSGISLNSRIENNLNSVSMCSTPKVQIDTSSAGHLLKKKVSRESMKINKQLYLKSSSKPAASKTNLCAIAKGSQRIKNLPSTPQSVEGVIYPQNNNEMGKTTLNLSNSLDYISYPSTPDTFISSNCDEMSMSSFSNESICNSTCKQSQALIIDSYTCRSGKRNKKLKKEMKKMQILMRQELGQPKMESKKRKMKKLRLSFGSRSLSNTSNPTQ